MTTSIAPVQRAGALALGLVFPVFTVKMLVVPLTTRVAADKVALATDHPGLLHLNAVLQLAVALLLVAGLVAPLTLVTGRGTALVRWGVALAGLGSMSFAHDSAYSLFLLSTRDGDSTAMTELVQRLDSLAAPVELPLLVCFAVSLLVLGGGALRAGLLPRWAYGLVVVAFLLQLAPPVHVLGVLQNAVAAVAFAVLARRLTAATRGRTSVPDEVLVAPAVA
ncbi:MAG: hypothetical protein ACTHQ3_08135 [Motilibacteraceae bacterium]